MEATHKRRVDRLEMVYRSNLGPVLFATLFLCIVGAVVPLVALAQGDQERTDAVSAPETGFVKDASPQRTQSTVPFPGQSNFEWPAPTNPSILAQPRQRSTSAESRRRAPRNRLAAGFRAQRDNLGYAIDLQLMERLFGDCRAAEFEKNLRQVRWFDDVGGGHVSFSSAHGAAERLRAVAEELAKLPDHFRDYFVPIGEATKCAPVDSTLTRPGLFRYGVALRLNDRYRDFWRWNKPDAAGRYEFKNAIPREVIEVFERNGFLWGGRWDFFDTGYFEYRPDLAGKP